MIAIVVGGNISSSFSLEVMKATHATVLT